MKEPTVLFKKVSSVHLVHKCTDFMLPSEISVHIFCKEDMHSCSAIRVTFTIYVSGLNNLQSLCVKRT